MKINLTDDALADLIRRGEEAERTVRPAALVPTCDYLSTLREVQRLRESFRLYRDDRARDLSVRLATVIRENNALRKRNERLENENAELCERSRRSESANTTAQTMAARWKLKATGEPLDD